MDKVKLSSSTMDKRRLCSPALNWRVLRRCADHGMTTDVSLASVAAYGESKAPFYLPHTLGREAGVGRDLGWM